jgi:hypothetical protein
MRTVDCAKGQSVQRAIHRAPAAKPVVVVVKGTCTENIRILRDHVTLEGHKSGGDIIGRDPDEETLFIEGASNISIRSLTIAGDNVGINTHAAQLQIEKSSISNNGRRGLEIEDNSYVSIVDSVVSNNNGFGIEADQSVLDLSGNTHITHNTEGGVEAAALTSLDIEGNIVTVRNNDGFGIVLTGNSNLSAGGLLVTDNGQGGILLSLYSSADLSDSEVSEETNPGITLERDSGVVLQENTSVTPGVLCVGEDSSLEAEGSVSVRTNCPGF